MACDETLDLCATRWWTRGNLFANDGQVRWSQNPLTALFPKQGSRKCNELTILSDYYMQIIDHNVILKPYSAP